MSEPVSEMSRPAWIAVTALAVALLGAGPARAERVAFAGTTLSFDPPPEPYLGCGAERPCVKPVVGFSYSGKIRGKDPQPFSPGFTLTELDQGRWATPKAYIATVSEHGERILPPRAATLGGIPALEFARKGSGNHTNWSPAWTEVNHMFVFESQGKTYLCALSASAEVYEFVRAAFISFCGSIRDSAREPRETLPAAVQTRTP